MKRICVMLWVVVLMLSACAQTNVRKTKEINTPQSVPALSSEISAEIVGSGDGENDTEDNMNDEELVPQAKYVQEVLHCKKLLEGMEIIPFERISEIIPEPRYSELGSDLFIHTQRFYPYGDGDGIITPYIGLHYIDGQRERMPYLLDAIHRTIKNGFPFFSNVFKTSLDGYRFIYDGFDSPYIYMFNHGGYEFEYWAEFSHWVEPGYWEGDDLSYTFPDDLSFCIAMGEETILVNHELGKMAYLPNLNVKKGIYKNINLITRDHKNLIYSEDNSIKKYNLLEGTVSEIFIDESMGGYQRLLSIKNDDELYYGYGEKQYCLNINTGESNDAGRFMYNMTQSPDGKYIAYTHPNYLDVGYTSDEAFFEYQKLFEEEFGTEEIVKMTVGGGYYGKHIPGKYSAEYGGTFIQDAETGEIVKVLPDEFFVGWFCEKAYWW